MDDETHWQRQVLLGLVLLLVVGALIGGIVAFAGIKVADLAGVNNDKPGRTTQRLHVPRNGDTPSTAQPPATSTKSPATPAPTAPLRHQPPDGLTLSISPRTTASYSRINLAGTYDVPDGSTLQVQRRQGAAWVDFPTTATVTAGRFATYVETGQFGINRFRVTDMSRGVSSKAAIVTVL